MSATQYDGAGDLVVWLRAQIDEDERNLDRWDSDGRARVATMWTGPEPGYTTVASDHGDSYWVADGRHIADARHVRVLWDPARVLRDVEASRRIIAFHESHACPDCQAQRLIDDDPSSCCTLLRLLASPYADQPGYRQEWAPLGGEAE